MRFLMNEVYLPALDIATGRKLRQTEAVQEGSLIIDDHHLLDLTEGVRQYAVAALPLKPLCKPQCRGLCHQCGGDLNHGPCQCVTAEDPRWSPLNRLLSGTADG